MGSWLAERSQAIADADIAEHAAKLTHELAAQDPCLKASTCELVAKKLACKALKKKQAQTAVEAEASKVQFEQCEQLIQALLHMKKMSNMSTFKVEKVA